MRNRCLSFAIDRTGDFEPTETRNQLFDLSTDPHIGSGNALCAKSSIPPAHVLGSKHSVRGNNAEDEMQKAGHYVSVEQAGRLLREVQSDSEDDMVR